MWRFCRAFKKYGLPGYSTFSKGRREVRDILTATLYLLMFIRGKTEGNVAQEIRDI